MPQNTSMIPSFSSLRWFAVRAGLSRAGHARSLMEGLEGPPSDWPFVTPAARRPRSGTELGGSGRGEGLLLRVAQATTTDTGTNCGFRGCAPACRLQAGDGAAGARTRISSQGSTPLVYGTGNPAPATPARSCLSAPGHPSAQSRTGIDLASSRSRDLHGELGARCSRSGGLPCAH